MFGVGMGELIVVFLIILFLFGARRLPEMAQAMGRSIKEFKKAANEMRETVELEAIKESDKRKA